MVEIETAASALLDLCRNRGWRIATAESCTGGLIAGALTAIAGSSDIVEGGFVTYSNASKILVLGVPAGMIERVGAVSAEVACAMARGALARLPDADLAIAVTGIAGPGGATPVKPVGLVHFGLTHRDGTVESHQEVFPGDRDAVRRGAVLRALLLMQARALRSDFCR
jgi:nicotinamide-nucleotide amidase